MLEGNGRLSCLDPETGKSEGKIIQTTHERPIVAKSIIRTNSSDPGSGNLAWTPTINKVREDVPKEKGHSLKYLERSNQTTPLVTQTGKWRGPGKIFKQRFSGRLAAEGKVSDLEKGWKRSSRIVHQAILGGRIIGGPPGGL